MAGRIEITAEAERDLLDAYDWYERFRVGLGEEFLLCVDARIESILRSPMAHEIVVDAFRRALVRRFPFAIFYEYDGATVVIYGVLHTARDPDKWRRRLEGS